MHRHIKSTLLSLSLSLLFSTAIFSAAHRTANAQSTELPEWKVNPETARQLGGKSKLQNYTIRPPLDTILEDGTRRNMYRFEWKNQNDPTGMTPAVSGEIITLLPDVSVPKPEKMLTQSMLIMRKRYVNFTCSPVEQGKINGIPFVRVRWSGMNHQHDQFQGLTYLAVDGRNIISLSAQDIKLGAGHVRPMPDQTSGDPDATAGATNGAEEGAAAPEDNAGRPSAKKTDVNIFQVAEAAILTFRKP